MSDILTDLRAVLVTSPQRWLSLTESFSDELLRRQPAPGEWSTLECLLHVYQLDQEVFPQRVRAILAGENFPAFFPDEEGSQLGEDVSPMQLAQEFATIRAENLHLLDEIAPEDLEKTAVHAELGEVSLGNLLHEWGGHDLMHLVQAEQALMQSFISGCGAWESYFVKHKAEG